jgi:hypothetical protein
MDHLPSYEFQKCVERYRGDSHPSVVTLKPAICGHFKTGHREVLRHIW